MCGWRIRPLLTNSTGVVPAGAILQFVRDTTTRVEGVGDVCSLAVFDFDRHGNRKYGARSHANKRMRSKQVGHVAPVLLGYSMHTST
jgi:hypothetical protein